MKQLRFEDHDSYVETQRRTLLKRGIGPYFCDAEMLRIAEWCKANNLQVKRGICHGARNGKECLELMRNLPLAQIIGTDLFPFSGKSVQQVTRADVEVVEWDFGRINNDWKEEFDLIYTNSLDHSSDPKETLLVWLDQLKWNGALFVQWNRSDMAVKGGDCFGADPLEMIDLLNEVGRLVDMIYVKTAWEKGNCMRRHGLECIVYVVQKRRR